MSQKLSQNKIQIEELMGISICLAVVGGFLDAYTYLIHGGVFANAQTGNMVLLSISLAKRNFIGSGYYFIPILAFFAGILVTEILKRRLSAAEFYNWQPVTVAIELGLLLVVGFLPRQVPSAVINVTVSFVCSLQVNSFRHIKGLPYASTMCTGNLRSAAEQLSLFLFDKKRDAGMKSLRYFFVILAFCGGAGLGAVLTGLWREKSVFVCCALLVVVLGAIAKNNGQWRLLKKRD